MPPSPEHLAWRQNLGYGSALVGLLVFILGTIWLVNAFVTPGSPALFSKGTAALVMGGGFLLVCFGVALVWPANESRP